METKGGKAVITEGAIAVPPTWTVHEYHGRAGLMELEADWRRLYSGMSQRTCFHSFDSHLAFVDHLMIEPDRLRCIALTDGQSVRAICPLEARKEKALGFSIRVWAIPWQNHWSLADIVCPEDEARREFVPALVNHLRRDSEKRFLLVLGPLTRDSFIWDGIRGLKPNDYCEHFVKAQYVLDCEHSFDELQSRLSKRFRKGLRHSRNQLEAIAKIHFETATSVQDLDHAFRVFLDLEASGWKGETGTRSAIRLHANLISFYQNHLTNGTGDPRCEINSLYANDDCIASEFCLCAGNEYISLKIGYHEAFARFSPGQLLTRYTLERCCQDPGIKRLNLGSNADGLHIWKPDSVVLHQAHVAIGGLSANLFIALLRFRFGCIRRFVRRLRTLHDRLSSIIFR